MAEVEFPVETSMLSDGTLLYPAAGDAGCSIRRDGRHSGMTNANFVDGHAKVVKVRPVNATGEGAIICPTLDGKTQKCTALRMPDPIKGTMNLGNSLSGQWGLGIEIVISLPSW